MVVLNPRWLCGTVIGHLLSHEHLEQARVTGCYTVDDFQLLFPEMDALDLLQVTSPKAFLTRSTLNFFFFSPVIVLAHHASLFAGFGVTKSLHAM